jgi:hypothetical protein
MSVSHTTWSSSAQPLVDRFKHASRWCGRLGALIGVGMLALWIVRPPIGIPALWLMKATTAQCLAFSGLALSLGLEGGGWRRRTRQVLLSLSGTIGAATLLDYAAGLFIGIPPLGLGQALDFLDAGPMAPQIAGAVVVFAVGALAAARRNGLASHLCDACIIGMAALLHAVMSGYFFHDLAYIGVSADTRMSPQTIFAFSVLWLGLIFARSDAGLAQILTGDGRGSSVIRYLLPPTTLFPIVISSVRLWGEGTVDWARYAPLFATIQSVTRIAVVITLGYLLNRSEAQRKAEKERREKAEEMVAMCAWTRRVRWNDEWIPVDRFLEQRFGLEITHSISDEALQHELSQIELRDRASAA